MSKANPRFRRTNPPLPGITGAVYNVIVGGTGEAGQWLMNIGYMASSLGQTPSSESNLSSSWAAQFGATLKALMSNQYNFGFVKVVCVNAPTRNPFVNTTAAALGPGTQAFAPLTSTLAVVASKKTAIRGQHGRGRNYHAGAPVTAVVPATDPDRITPAFQTAVQSLWASMLINPLVDGAATANLAVFTRVLHGAPVVFAAFVQTVFVSSILGTVRRRKLFRGK